MRMWGINAAKLEFTHSHDRRSVGDVPVTDH
jgi:hypothetical protein